VDADTEREMLALLAVNVEHVAVRRVLAMVAAGRGDEHHRDAVFGNGLTVVVDVAGDVTRDVRCRRFEAQQFLDRLWDQGGLFDEVASLLGMFGQ
jgi:hypothetical protein